MVKRKRLDKDESDIVERVFKKVKKLVKTRRRIISSSSSSSNDSSKEGSALSPAHSNQDMEDIGMSDEEFQGKLFVKKIKNFATTFHYY